MSRIRRLALCTLRLRDSRFLFPTSVRRFRPRRPNRASICGTQKGSERRFKFGQWCCQLGCSKQLLLGTNRLLNAKISSMVTKRRAVLKSSPSGNRQAPSPAPAAKKRTGKKAAPTRVRTRTSIVGMTIYMPDVEPSARGRKLLEALERLKG
jgi:hypothetical protein